MRFHRLFFPLLIVLVVSSGCATRPKIDWKARVGNYTYDQSVTELGVPDKEAKLSDGSIVSEWLVRRYAPDYVTFGFGTVWSGRSVWAGPEFGWASPVGAYYNRWLRLVFGPDGKLREFKHYER